LPCARWTADEASLATMTLEQLLDAGTLLESTVAALRGRYLFE
jgi:hypothetical protein